MPRTGPTTSVPVQSISTMRQIRLWTFGQICVQWLWRRASWPSRTPYMLSAKTNGDASLKPTHSPTIKDVGYQSPRRNTYPSSEWLFSEKTTELTIWIYRLRLVQQQDRRTLRRFGWSKISIAYARGRGSLCIHFDDYRMFYDWGRSMLRFWPALLLKMEHYRKCCLRNRTGKDPEPHYNTLQNVISNIRIALNQTCKLCYIKHTNCYFY